MVSPVGVHEGGFGNQPDPPHARVISEDVPRPCRGDGHPDHAPDSDEEETRERWRRYPRSCREPPEAVDDPARLRDAGRGRDLGVRAPTKRPRWRPRPRCACRRCHYRNRAQQRYGSAPYRHPPIAAGRTQRRSSQMTAPDAPPCSRGFPDTE